MTLSPSRLLGFAFANADLLIEIDRQSHVSFAIGASETLSGSSETSLIGRPWSDFVDSADRAMLKVLLDGLDDGMRAGPVVVALADAGDGVPRAAALSGCRLPQNHGVISCALTRAVRPPLAGAHGLHEKASFEAVTATLFETARSTGQELELALIEMGGLSAARESMTPDAAREADERIAGLLRAQSHGGAAAADLGADRFALVRQRTKESPDVLAGRIGRLIDLGAEHQLEPDAAAVALAGEYAPGALLRAIRFSLNGFIRDGLPDERSVTLGEAVSRSMRQTLMDAGALNRAVAERSFRLVYQPVVDLKSGGALHHHEVLVRFGDEASPFPLIRMAEELDLIEPLDLAILERTVNRLAADPALTLAVNISGRTIGSPDFVGAVRAILAAKAGVRARLIFELTESAAIDDLAIADRHLQALRAEGCRVCLDDFGAGAASLAYLQQLTLDVVKIDGRYIRELQHGGRESTFIRHLVTMCGELGVKTLAEMVETEQAEDAVRRAGVDFAQGWLYGAPQDKPGPAAARAAPSGPRPVARRVGAVESWR